MQNSSYCSNRLQVEFISESVQTLSSIGGAVPEHLLPYELELDADVTLERLILFVSEMDRRPSIPGNWEMLPQVLTETLLSLMAVWLNINSMTRWLETNYTFYRDLG